jgi:hypothetical protein
MVGIFSRAESCGTPPGMADGITIGIGAGAPAVPKYPEWVGGTAEYG